MTVFKVRFKMASPIYIKADKAAQPIMLDAILGFIWCQEHGYHKTSAESIVANQVFPELPIKRKGKCYMCSAMILPKGCKINMQYDALSKRDNYRKIINRTMPSFESSKDGIIKGAIMKYWALATPYIDFLVDVTDEQEFRRLISKIYSIGPKKAAGYGRILETIIEKAPDGVEAYKTADGYPTRPIPVSTPDVKFAENTIVGESTYYAPYWCLVNQTTCYLPNVSQYNQLPAFNAQELIDEAVGRTETEINIDEIDIEAELSAEI